VTSIQADAMTVYSELYQT